MYRKKQGFTISEVLSTVVILGILLALAVPAVLTVQKNMDMTRLDHAAKQIFMAAQNNLISRRAAGTLDSVKFGEGVGNCYWVTESTPELDQVLPDGSIDMQLASEYFAIFYNAHSATVLEVYFADEPLPESDTLRSRFGGDHRDARREYRIGFYSGDDLPLSENERLQFHPALVEIENGDELTVHVDAPMNTRKEHATLTISVQELDSQHQLVGQPVEIFRESIRLSSHKFEVTLDSLSQSDQQFSKLFPDLTPGADIRVQADILPPEGSSALSSTAWQHTNSLFASRAEDTVKISTARHLQNLSAPHSNVAGIAAAEQVQDILWPEAQLFTPIENDELTAYQGNRRLIDHLISKNGLFGSISDISLTGIRLAGPMISGGSGFAGALALETMNAEISDCYAFCPADQGQIDSTYASSIVSGQTVGGLVGHAGSGTTITHSLAALPEISGSVAGGLVGSSSTDVSLINCYSAVGYHISQDNQFVWSGGLKGRSKAGGLIGNSRTSFVKNCYAVGFADHSATAPLCSGSAKIKNSYWALDLGTGTQQCGFTISGSPQPASLEELKNLLPSLGQGFHDHQPMTFAYSEACPGIYPFPALSDSVSGDAMPHYGDWPMQAVNDMRLFNSRNQEIEYIMVPSGGTVNAKVQVFSGDQPQDIPAEVSGSGRNAGTLFRWDTPSYDAATKMTQLVVTGYGTLHPGVSYLDLTAGGYTLRVPVLTYQAELELTADTDSAGTIKNHSTAADPQTETDTTVLNLKSSQKTHLQATLTVSPDANYINRELQGIRNSLDAGVSLSMQSSSEISSDDWLGIQTVREDSAQRGGPGIVENPPVDASQDLYVLWDCTEEKAQFPFAAKGTAINAQTFKSDVLTVSGQSAGSAKASVSWAMDDSLTVSCPIRVSGVQVAIKGASVIGERSGLLGENTSYPYILNLAPRPKESLTIELTPKLFGRAPKKATETYTWTITRGDQIVVGPIVKNPEGLDQPVTLTLEDSVPFAAYRINLMYSYQSKREQYSTSDFMYVTVHRQTSEQDDASHGIIQLDHAPLNDHGELSLEQIDWKTPPEGWTNGHLNQQQLAGHVDGAEDTQLNWYLKQDAFNAETKLTGKHMVPVQGADGAPIAELSWTPEEIGSSRGGTITVTALNSNYAGSEDLYFTLYAKARDNGKNEAAQLLEIPVRIYPQLSITPKSKVTAGFAGETSAAFSANRTDKRFAYNWHAERVNGNGGFELSIPDRSEEYRAQLYTASDIWSGPRTFKVSLQYGPYQQEATLTANRILNEALYSINQDADGLFLVDKGKTRELEFSWGSSLVDSKITAHPAPAYYSGDTLIAEVTPRSNRVPTSEVGSFLYDVTGTEFSGDALKMTWKIKKTNVIFSDYVTPTFDLYVVGGEFDRSSCTDGILTMTVDDLSDYPGISLTYQSYFPEKAGIGTVTLETSQPGILSIEGPGVSAITQDDGNVAYIFQPSGTSVDERKLVLSSLSYGTTTLTATYTIGDYVYRDNITVRVAPPAGRMLSHLEYCTSTDIARLATLFPQDSFTQENGSPKPLVTSATYPDEGMVPTIFSQAVFSEEGYDTIYLKAWLTDGASIVSNLNPYRVQFSSDNIDAADCHALPYQNTGIYYLRIQAINGSLGGEDVHIHADFGPSMEKSMPIKIYSTPSVFVFDEGGQDVTNQHTLIEGFDRLTHQNDYQFTGTLFPDLMAQDSSGHWQPLDRLVWFLEYPAEGYGGLTLSGTTPTEGDPVIGNSVTVHIAQDPQCKAVVKAQSELAHRKGYSQYSVSGHALTFIPNWNS